VNTYIEYRLQINADICVCCEKGCNQKSSLKQCKTCCCQVDNWCKLTDHRRAKEENRLEIKPKPDLPSLLPGLVMKVNSAITAKRALYITYSGGSKPGPNVCKISPIEWDCKNHSFKAYCSKRQAKQHFLLKCITHYGETLWDVLKPLSLSMQGIKLYDDFHNILCLFIYIDVADHQFPSPYLYQTNHSIQHL
jgi:hypothetical protein